MGLQMSRRRNGIAYPFDSVPQTLLSTVQSLLDQTEFQLVKMDLACSSECSQRSVRSEEEQTPVDLQQLDSDSLRPVSSPQSLVVVPHHPSPSSTKKERLGCFRSERSMKKTNQSRSIENVQNTLTTDQSLTQTQPVLIGCGSIFIIICTTRTVKTITSITATLNNLSIKTYGYGIATGFRTKIPTTSIKTICISTLFFIYEI
ncbi:hypothetical protein QR98_0047750 [Sarcoptes scabiei]|uniref:Uncharacterized protein n=1 Tax=Sarcoptes scabiei TaxID=52283 RepID=A0A132A5R3_SARSC|nr:hypothetical protein QR98_0047750 [Sarcoptes scabiei]